MKRIILKNSKKLTKIIPVVYELVSKEIKKHHDQGIIKKQSNYKIVYSINLTVKRKDGNSNVSIDYFKNVNKEDDNARVKQETTESESKITS